MDEQPKKPLRSQAWFGHTDLHDYTIQSDVLGFEKDGKLPDIGLTTLSEVTTRAGSIARATDLPTLADADETTVIGVIDARSMHCLAELRTPQIVPFGFHAAFRPA